MPIPILLRFAAGALAKKAVKTKNQKNLNGFARKEISNLQKQSNTDTEIPFDEVSAAQVYFLKLARNTTKKLSNNKKYNALTKPLLKYLNKNPKDRASFRSDITFTLIDLYSRLVDDIESGVESGLSKNSESILSRLSNQVSIITASLKKTTEAYKKALKDKAKSVKHTITSKIAEVANKAKEVTKKGLISGLKSLGLGFLVSSIGIALFAFWQKYGKNVKEFFISAWDNIIKPAFTVIKDIGASVFKSLKKFWDLYGDDIKKFLSRAASGIWNAVKDVWHFAENYWAKYGDTIKWAVGEMYDFFKKSFPYIEKMRDYLLGKVGDLIKWMAGPGFDMLSKLMNGGLETLQEGIDNINKAIDWAENVLTTDLMTVKKSVAQDINGDLFSTSSEKEQFLEIQKWASDKDFLFNFQKGIHLISIIGSQANAVNKARTSYAASFAKAMALGKQGRQETILRFRTIISNINQVIKDSKTAEDYYNKAISKLNSNNADAFITNKQEMLAIDILSNSDYIKRFRVSILSLNDVVKDLKSYIYELLKDDKVGLRSFIAQINPTSDDSEEFEFDSEISYSSVNYVQKRPSSNFIFDFNEANLKSIGSYEVERIVVFSNASINEFKNKRSKLLAQFKKDFAGVKKDFNISYLDGLSEKVLELYFNKVNNEFLKTLLNAWTSSSALTPIIGGIQTALETPNSIEPEFYMNFENKLKGSSSKQIIEAAILLYPGFANIARAIALLIMKCEALKGFGKNSEKIYEILKAQSIENAKKYLESGFLNISNVQVPDNFLADLTKTKETFKNNYNRISASNTESNSNTESYSNSSYSGATPASQSYQIDSKFDTTKIPDLTGDTIDWGTSLDVVNAQTIQEDNLLKSKTYNKSQIESYLIGRMKQLGFTTKEMALFLASTIAESGLKASGMAEQWRKVQGQTFEKPSDYFNSAFRSGTFTKSDYSSTAGNSSPEDGVKYRGRGILQMTGKGNYSAFQQYLNNYSNLSANVVEHPEVVSLDPKYATESALAWWMNHKNARVAAQNGDIETTRKYISGGGNLQLPKVTAAYEKYLDLLNSNGLSESNFKMNEGFGSAINPGDSFAQTNNPTSKPMQVAAIALKNVTKDPSTGRSKPANKSAHYCAKAVKNAVVGALGVPYPAGNARDFYNGRWLKSIGYHYVGNDFSSTMPGDIAVNDYAPYGHIQVKVNNKNWASDFLQNGPINKGRVSIWRYGEGDPKEILDTSAYNTQETNEFEKFTNPAGSIMTKTPKPLASIESPKLSNQTVINNINNSNTNYDGPSADGLISTFILGF